MFFNVNPLMPKGGFEPPTESYKESVLPSKLFRLRLLSKKKLFNKIIKTFKLSFYFKVNLY